MIFITSIFNFYFYPFFFFSSFLDFFSSHISSRPRASSRPPYSRIELIDLNLKKWRLSFLNCIKLNFSNQTVFIVSFSFFSIELIFIFSIFCICATWYLHNWKSLYPIPPNRNEMCDKLQSVFCQAVATSCFHSAFGLMKYAEQMQSKLKNFTNWTLMNWAAVFSRNLLGEAWNCEIWNCFEILNFWIEETWIRNCFWKVGIFENVWNGEKRKFMKMFFETDERSLEMEKNENCWK